MKELIREIYLGRVSRGKADFRVTLIIEFNLEYPERGFPVYLYVKYAGHKYHISEKISWFVGDVIKPAEGVTANVIGSIYLLHELYMSYRSSKYSYELLMGVVLDEINQGRRYGIGELEKAMSEANGGNRVDTSYHDFPEIPESTLIWLFSLPGTGVSWDDVLASTTVSEEDFMNIISTTG